MSDRGQRRHDERRVYARRQRRTPGYVARHPGKTPGKTCSGPDCCGNPRRAVWLWKPQRGPTIQERRATQDTWDALLADVPAPPFCTDPACCDECPGCGFLVCRCGPCGYCPGPECALDTLPA